MEDLQWLAIFTAGFLLAALFLSTLNLGVTLIAFLTLGMSVISSIGFLVHYPTKLGQAELVMFTLCTALASQLVVHFASSYSNSRHDSKFTRTQECLREASIGLVKSTFTYIAAIAILYRCQVPLFKMFTQMAVTTLTFTLVYTLLFFPAACHLIGPQGLFCDLRCCCRKKPAATNK